MSNLSYKAHWAKLLKSRFNVSDNELARKIGRPRQSVAQWQNGTRPSLPAMIDICNAFNITPDFFFEVRNE